VCWQHQVCWQQSSVSASTHSAHSDNYRCTAVHWPGGGWGPWGSRPRQKTQWARAGGPGAASQTRTHACPSSSGGRPGRRGCRCKGMKAGRGVKRGEETSWEARATHKRRTSPHHPCALLVPLCSPNSWEEPASKGCGLLVASCPSPLHCCRWSSSGMEWESQTHTYVCRCKAWQRAHGAYACAPAIVQEVRRHQYEVNVGGATQLQALLRQLHALVCTNGGVHFKWHWQEGELRQGEDVARRVWATAVGSLRSGAWTTASVLRLSKTHFQMVAIFSLPWRPYNAPQGVPEHEHPASPIGNTSDLRPPRIAKSLQIHFNNCMM